MSVTDFWFDEGMYKAVFEIHPSLNEDEYPIWEISDQFDKK